MKYLPWERFAGDRCNGCGTCVEVCPTGAVELVGGKPVFRIDPCIGCGHCGAFCPVNSFNLEPLPGIPSNADEAYTALLAARRTARSFAGRVPGKEELHELLSVLEESPTGRNSQGITVRVLVGAEASRRLFSPIRKTLRLLRPTGLPAILGKLTNTAPYVSRMMRGEDLVFRNAPVVMFFMVSRNNVTWRSDGIIAAATVMYKAEAMGLGTFWNGVAEKLYPFFPSWHSRATRGFGPAAVLCAGYPAARPRWKVPPRDYRVIFEVRR